MSENQIPSLLFYRQIIPLIPGQHGGLKIQTNQGYGFAATTNSVPVAGVELAEVCKEYPVVFVPTEAGGAVPVAVLGFANGENLFLDGERQWQAHYLPAFVRRYPFILADNPETPDRPVVCVDESCPWLGQELGEPLFAAGQPSPLLEQTLKFLADFHAQSARTATFGRKLKDWGLLVESQAQATTADGKSHTLTGIWVVDEAALSRLAADRLEELFRAGELAWIYFHLASLTNFRRLAERKPA